MDYMSNKALIIAVSLIVTMAIASAVLLIINQVVTVYGQVYETDTSIQSGFDEFDSYDNTQKTALDVLNTVKKYKNNSLVSVVDGNGSPYNEEDLKKSLNVENAGTEDLSVNSIEASRTYSSTIKRDNNKVTIILKAN